MRKTATVTYACAEIADAHPKQQGAIVVSIQDYQRLWDELEPEVKPFRIRTVYGLHAITVHEKDVIQRDEHEGKPRWASHEECSAWSHLPR